MGYSNYPGPLFLSMVLKSWRRFGQPSSQFHDHLNSSTPNLLENNLKPQALKKHPKQISNDTSFHDWTINPNSEKLIIRSVKTHEQFLKEFGINMNKKNN